ncbi:heterogeneous nuclear ribonucleoproteins A1 homolog [Anopheles cruzii]|uniref:heterogeneous nuclear ribonucleoproteins A1 homolog n=1 Tax=Anopheles cruzii TaxID=68878 RepID=UPI0022EC6704|nr:heterogeneous nuclear ribonucleoproteins A1 homolog [Anopheles cruzii]
MRTVYTVFFLVAVSFFADIVVAGVVHIRKGFQQDEQSATQQTLRIKRQLLPVLGGGFPRGFQPNFFNSQRGGFNGFSGAGASSNALSQNFGGAGFSSSNANADAFSQSFGLGQGAGASAANAQAQSFQAGGPFGSFGASAANAASQGFSAGPDGLSGSASFAGSQTYNFPGDHKISLAYSNGFSLANGQPSASNGFSISESK